VTDRIRLRGETILAARRFPLREILFDYRRKDGRWQTQRYEVYGCGDAVAILPYDPARGVVLLARQFRLAAFLNGGSESLIEACAGMLAGSDPESRVREEAEEELGCRVTRLHKLFTAFASPGVSTERITYFVAEYSSSDRISAGGGLAGEGEDIEVIELPLDRALDMIGRGEIVDAKTIILHVKLHGLSDASRSAPARARNTGSGG
jgi:nudix-type nucleoside diphosphatase (YffH/AdpP family)